MRHNDLMDYWVHLCKEFSIIVTSCVNSSSMTSRPSIFFSCEMRSAHCSRFSEEFKSSEQTKQNTWFVIAVSRTSKYEQNVNWIMSKIGRRFSFQLSKLLNFKIKKAWITHRTSQSAPWRRTWTTDEILNHLSDSNFNQKKQQNNP